MKKIGDEEIGIDLSRIRQAPGRYEELERGAARGADENWLRAVGAAIGQDRRDDESLRVYFQILSEALRHVPAGSKEASCIHALAEVCAAALPRHAPIGQGSLLERLLIHLQEKEETLERLQEMLRTDEETLHTAIRQGLGSGMLLQSGKWWSLSGAGEEYAAEAEANQKK